MIEGAGKAQSCKSKISIGDLVGGTYGADWQPQPILVKKFPKFLRLLVINVCIAGSHKTFLSQCMRAQVKPNPEKARFP